MGLPSCDPTKKGADHSVSAPAQASGCIQGMRSGLPRGRFHVSRQLPRAVGCEGDYKRGGRVRQSHNAQGYVKVHAIGYPSLVLKPSEGETPMALDQYSTLLAAVQAVPDPRKPRGKRYPWAVLLTILV